MKRAVANFRVEFIVVVSKSAERYNAESPKAMEGSGDVTDRNALKFGVVRG
jgi:hypothetical protein